MAGTKLELLYYEGGSWANARYRWWKTALDPDDWESNAGDQGTDINPVTTVHISDSVGNPRRAKITLINRPRQVGSTTDNEGKGRFTGVFTDFMDVRLRDRETGAILLLGKVYDVNEKFDFRYGASIELDVRDAVEELKNSRTGSWPDLSFTGNSTTKSSMISTMLTDADYTGSTSIVTNGQNKITTSLRPQESNGALEFKGNKSTLAEIAQLAAEEPHSKETREGFKIALVNEASDVNATVTEIDVDGLQLGYANAAAALSSSDYIAIDAEIMAVESVSTNTITVLRGVRGTTAATHANNAVVYRNPGASKFGFDYHVDPAVQTTSVGTNDNSDWNYYQRGTRPDSPSTYGMTVKYPAATAFTSDGFNKLMQNDFAFDNTNDELYTDVILEYTEKGPQRKGDGSVDNAQSGGASVAKRRKFERLNLTGAGGRLIVEGMVKLGRTHEAGYGGINNTTDPVEFSIDEYDIIGEADTGATGAFQLVNVNDYIQIGNEIMKVTAVDSSAAYTITVARAQYGTSAASHADNSIIYRNPFGDPDDWGGKPFGQTEILNADATGGHDAGAFGRIEYQSHSAAMSGLENEDPPGFIIVSPFSSAGDTDDMRFNSHMPETSVTVTGSTLSNTVTTHANCRLAKVVGMKKTKVIKNSTSSDPASLRRQVVSLLSRNSASGIKRGEFKVSGYPYTYIDAAAADVSRSTATITFASGAFADNNSGTTNNPKLFGVLQGDVICEMDSTATTITRYAYISSVTSSTVVYGASSADTSDGTALDASKPMRIYVPLRAGHVIRVTNSLVQEDRDHLVTELVYDEGSGVTMTSISSIGQNDSAATFRSNVLKEVHQNALKYGKEPPDTGGGSDNFSDSSVKWTINAEFTSTTTAQVNWAKSGGGDVTLSGDNGEKYEIGAANTGTMTGESIIYLNPANSSTAFATQLAKDYKEDKTLLKIGTANVGAVHATFDLADGISTSGGNNPKLYATPDKLLAPGVITVSDGAYDAPSVTFAGSAGRNTGLYLYESGATEYLGLTADGTLAAYFGENGAGIWFYENLVTPNDATGGAGDGYYYSGTSTYPWHTISYNNANAVSDERLKENIISISDAGALDFVTAFTPRSFNWKTETEAETKYGLIAQEVKSTLDELGISNWSGHKISTETEDQIQSLDMTQFIAPLMGAVKELKRRLEKLEGEQ